MANSGDVHHLRGLPPRGPSSRSVGGRWSGSGDRARQEAAVQVLKKGIAMFDEANWTARRSQAVA